MFHPEITDYVGEYSYLSNSTKCSIWLEGVRYPTSMHAYQAQKLLNREHKIELSKCADYAGIKKFLKNKEIRSDWSVICDDIMMQILRLKFENVFFADLLIKTHPKRLDIKNEWLGKKLMIIRSELIENSLDT